MNYVNYKKSFLPMLFFVVVFLTFPGSVLGACGDSITGGTGTSGDPYQINDAAELAATANCLGSGNSGKYFKLINNIDLGVSPYNSGSGWTPIGSASGASAFYGKFNGDYKTLSNLFIYRPSTSNLGLFGYVASGAVIENVVLSNVNVEGGGSNVGALAGYLDGTIQNAGVSSGTVKGLMRLGGLVGSNEGLVQRSYASTTVTQKAASSDCCVGGVTGATEFSGAINNSYARGRIIHTSSGQSNMGGAVGSTYTSTGLSYLYSTGSITSTGSLPSSNIGGLAGNSYVSATNSYWDTQSSGLSTSYSGTGKTTSQMKDQSTFSGWDFSTVWAINASINNGYPYLLWESSVASDATAPTVSVTSPTSGQSVSGASVSFAAESAVATGVGSAASSLAQDYIAGRPLDASRATVAFGATVVSTAFLRWGLGSVADDVLAKKLPSVLKNQVRYGAVQETFSNATNIVVQSSFPSSGGSSRGSSSNGSGGGSSSSLSSTLSSLSRALTSLSNTLRSLIKR